MTATPALTTDLQRQVLLLEDDLRQRVAANPELEGRWKQEHQRALENERTAASWVAWRDDRVTQAAVAWVLTTVFVRFCEDNALVAPVWITGPEQRRQEALDAQLAYFRAHPEDTDREWLMQALQHLADLPATKALVDAHSALHLVSPSGDAVTALLDFWRHRGDDGALIHDLADTSLSTRFLGDLYQDLSQYAKDTYALLQTPVFVEEFILDRTLEPALAERPLEGFKLIDPACGSGHFLLGAFDRLLDRWHRRAPALEIQARVQVALDAIHGVDLNPFSIAIARFRLTVAALNASGFGSLETAPAFTFHLAVGDSLIHGPDRDVLPGMADRTAYMPFTYASEDGPLLLTLLGEEQYDVVVGNPPYITVKDKALNKIYRSKYADVCKGKYAMTVPFMALFFALAKEGERAGWMGQITSNSFMKREFGTKLIEDFLVKQDLCLVADTSGAYIPGHGTPTVILVGRSRSPVGSTMRAVLGVRGEPSRPENPAKGQVWASLTEHVDSPGWDDAWITVTDLDRELISRHPWSLSGGGAVELTKHIGMSKSRLRTIIDGTIGFAGVPGMNEIYYVPSGYPRRIGATVGARDLVDGKSIADWNVMATEQAFAPYEHGSERLFSLAEIPRWRRHLWPLRTQAKSIKGFSGDRSAPTAEWWIWQQWSLPRHKASQLIAYTFITTHNEFALTSGTPAINHAAPVIKLREGATGDEYLALLGALNSSTACFWLKQNSHNKGSQGINEGVKAESWERFYEFTGTTLQDYPLPERLPLERARVLDGLARGLIAHRPSAVCAESVPSPLALAEARKASEQIRARMIAMQEELDWEYYRLYGVVNDDLTYAGDDLPGLRRVPDLSNFVWSVVGRVGSHGLKGRARHVIM